MIYNLNENIILADNEIIYLKRMLTYISIKTKCKLNTLNFKLSHFKTNTIETNLIQDEINITLQQWADKVRRLGAIPVSLCKVRIPNQFELWEHKG